MKILTKEKAIKIFELADKKINELAVRYSISKEDLERSYYQPDFNLSSITDYEMFLRLAISLQNSGNMRNSIKFGSNQKIIKRVVENLVSGKYNCCKEIYHDFINNGIVDNGVAIRKNIEDFEKTNWGKYCKGLWNFYELYRDENIAEKIRKLDRNLDNTLNMVDYLTKNIHSLGFALACDFLKECGCYWLAKPDTHIIKICSAIYDIDEKELNQEQCVKLMNNLVTLINEKYPSVTEYQLDRSFWLISTNNFYKHPQNVIDRESLCEKIQEITSAN